MDKADVVIKSDAVFTGDGLEPFKGGVAVRGDKIVACGTMLTWHRLSVPIPRCATLATSSSCPA